MLLRPLALACRTVAPRRKPRAHPPPPKARATRQTNRFALANQSVRKKSGQFLQDDWLRGCAGRRASLLISCTARPEPLPKVSGEASPPGMGVRHWMPFERIQHPSAGMLGKAGAFVANTFLGPSSRAGRRKWNGGRRISKSNSKRAKRRGLLFIQNTEGLMGLPFSGSFIIGAITRRLVRSFPPSGRHLAAIIRQGSRNPPSPAGARRGCAARPSRTCGRGLQGTAHFARGPTS